MTLFKCTYVSSIWAAYVVVLKAANILKTEQMNSVHCLLQINQWESIKGKTEDELKYCDLCFFKDRNKIIVLNTYIDNSCFVLRGRSKFFKKN